MSLTVDHGSCCVVMGASGAGKSTLLQAIAGLVDHRGIVSIDGVDLGGRQPHRRGVGMLFQHARLFPTMTALDNVAYPLRVRGVARRTRREAALSLLDQVGLGARGSARPEELSGGERQRVALARALCSEPAVLLLDEPLTGLDVPQRRDLVQLLAALRKTRMETWVIVGHDPDDAFRLADSIAVLDRGRLVQHGAAAEVRARPSTAIVTALLSNPNVLTGLVRHGCVAFGDAQLPWPSPDGTITATIRPEHTSLAGRTDGAADHRDRVRCPMTVVAVEHRASGVVAVLEGGAGHLEVPCDARPPGVDDAVTVLFDRDRLWQLDR